VIAERFQAQTGLAVVIENRVGAGGSIAAAALASSPLNGEVVGMQGKSYLLFKEEFPALKIDPSRDLAPVALLGRSATVLAIPAQSRFAGLKELTEFGRANPGQLTYASAGQGSTTFWAAQRMLAASKVTAVHIPFKGSPEIVSELLSGRVDFGYLPSLVASSQIVSGKLKAIAVSAARRLALFPQVPTTLELGLEDSEYESWLMALVPAKTPIAVQERLNRQFTDVVKSAETVAQLGRLGHETEAMNLAQLREFVAKEQVKSTEMARAIRGQRN
jgi:tripartite-type tricarboxylate transporter receptor subunit TctC